MATGTDFQTDIGRSLFGIVLIVYGCTEYSPAKLACRKFMYRAARGEGFPELAKAVISCIPSGTPKAASGLQICVTRRIHGISEAVPK